MMPPLPCMPQRPTMQCSTMSTTHAVGHPPYATQPQQFAMIVAYGSGFRSPSTRSLRARSTAFRGERNTATAANRWGCRAHGKRLHAGCGGTVRACCFSACSMVHSCRHSLLHVSPAYTTTRRQKRCRLMATRPPSGELAGSNAGPQPQQCTHIQCRPRLPRQFSKPLPSLQAGAQPAGSSTHAGGRRDGCRAAVAAALHAGLALAEAVAPAAVWKCAPSGQWAALTLPKVPRVNSSRKKMLRTAVRDAPFRV